MPLKVWANRKAMTFLLRTSKTTIIWRSRRRKTLRKLTKHLMTTKKRTMMRRVNNLRRRPKQTRQE